MMDNKKMWLADSALLVVAIIWGGGFVAGKMALTGFTAFNILMYRFLGSAIILGLVFNKKIRHVGTKELQCGAIIGVVQFAALLSQLVGLNYTSPAKQSFLVASYVVMVPFISWILTKSRPQIKDIFVAFVAMIGIALISLDGRLAVALGDSLSIGFAVLFAAQIVLVGMFAKGLDVIAMTFFQFLFAGTLALIASLITGFKTGVDPASLMGIIYFILFNTVIAMTLQNVAQKYTKDSHASLIISLESVFGFLISAMFYKEVFTHKMLLGCLLVFVAVISSKINISKGANQQPST